MLINEIALQPYVLMCGSLQEVTASYAVVGGHNYCVSTPIEAIDVCFKSTKVLGTRYCQVCSSSWQFLELHAYNFTCKSVEKSVSNLLIEFQNVK